MVRTTTLLLLALALSAGAEAATPNGDCSGSPVQAVLELPAPLSEWGTIVCTPYGHIISNHDGWIWSRPGGFSLVFVPSQMVRDEPQSVGNASHFTKIEFVEVSVADKATGAALAALREGLDPEHAGKAYRLSVTGSLGRSLVLYFFELGTSTWGIWCGPEGTTCKATTRFMVMDMRKGT